uniref:Uncharacterized protein n=1 Tax=Rhizophora mucronata TaxID=61149 RepID=A0A2P2Q005_RHIMU
MKAYLFSLKPKPKTENRQRGKYMDTCTSLKHAFNRHSHITIFTQFLRK